MGVNGDYLSHPNIKKHTKLIDLNTQSGKIAAVDVANLLYRGCLKDPVSIAKQQHEKVIDNEVGDVELIPVDYTIEKLQVLIGCGITPFVVIDGNALPSKADENSRRTEERERKYTEANAAFARGDLVEARKLYYSACSVPIRMRMLLKEACIANNIMYICSRYESDAQLVQLLLDALADFVISEDGDMLGFGSRTTVFKTNFTALTGEKVDRDDLIKDPDSPFFQFSNEMWVLQNIIQGNDYSPGVKGVGIVKACALVRRFPTLEELLEELGRQFVLSDDFVATFRQAYHTMLHYPVLMPEKGQDKTWQLHNLNSRRPAPGISDEYPFLAEEIDTPHATSVGSGLLDPKTLEVFVDDEYASNDQPNVPEVASCDAAPTSAMARVHAEKKQVMAAELRRLQADEEELKRIRALRDRLLAKEDTRVENLDEGSDYVMQRERYEYAVDKREKELIRQLPTNISSDKLKVDAEDTAMILARDHLLDSEGNIRQSSSLVNICKYTVRTSDGTARNNEISASLWDKKHNPFLLVNTGDGTGRHFNPNEIWQEAVGEPSADTIVRTIQIPLYEGLGDVAAFLFEQYAGELLRNITGGRGVSMNGCVSGYVRDTQLVATHGCAALLVTNALPKLQNHELGIHLGQSPNNLTDTLRNLPCVVRTLQCTTRRNGKPTAGAGSGKKTLPIPCIISTTIPPTNESTIFVPSSLTEAFEILKVSTSITESVIGDGIQVIAKSFKFSHDVYLSVYRASLKLKYQPGDKPQPKLLRLLKDREVTTGKDGSPILVSTSTDPRIGGIVVLEGLTELRDLIRGSLVKENAKVNDIDEGPVLVLNWEERKLEFYAHRWRIGSVGCPGVVLNQQLYDDLQSRTTTNGIKPAGAVSIFPSEKDANEQTNIVITTPGFRIIRTVLGGRKQLAGSEAIAGCEFTALIGSGYARAYKDGDGYLDENNMTIFFPQAKQLYPKLVDRLPENAVWIGKDKPKPRDSEDNSKVATKKKAAAKKAPSAAPTSSAAAKAVTKKAATKKKAAAKKAPSAAPTSSAAAKAVTKKAATKKKAAAKKPAKRKGFFSSSDSEDDEPLPKKQAQGKSFQCKTVAHFGSEEEYKGEDFSSDESDS